MAQPLKLTELVLRDAHQSLLATRLRIEDMLPMLGKLDEVGYWSMESWGGATFDACIRYLGEDPWERLRTIKKHMPKTPQQMLLRGQNLLGYRHYADDVVEAFVEKSAENGMDVFRIFDALNDFRNLETAVKATIKVGKHAQGTMSYTVSPVHTLDKWVDMGKELEDMGCHSICIKDMAGLLKPYIAFELVSRLKETCSIPIAMQSHATTGMSTVTNIKAAEAGIDMLDTAISSMSMTYGHSATESVVAILQVTDRDTGLDLHLLDEIADYFRKVRKKYAQFEGSLRGVDARILVAQVPGGMLTNMEKQLKEQGAADSFDEVLKEIPRVRKDLGYIPLVTPTSQIVGTQSVLNVLLGERYKNITKETQAILKGQYGATPIPVDKELQARVLKGEKPMTDRPADHIAPEMQNLKSELYEKAENDEFKVKGVEDVLTYALFPQVGLKFLKHRGDPSKFEPPPSEQPAAAPAKGKQAAPAEPQGPERYQVTVNGKSYDVEVAPGGAISAIKPQQAASAAAAPAPAAAAGPAEPVGAPLAGNIFKVLAKPGQTVASGDVVVILEAMKMETEVRAPRDGTVAEVAVKEGDSVEVGSTLLTLN
ncbi:MAG: sodium-extruding oxaloacetate decarboxylase subunit alpha [Gammaproteobacteria bacterium]|nr:sodium-extruding oxaloacetate decarboxylase subunit alpha [Gammaproteobacteria bacterium]